MANKPPDKPSIKPSSVSAFDDPDDSGSKSQIEESLRGLTETIEAAEASEAARPVGSREVRDRISRAVGNEAEARPVAQLQGPIPPNRTMWGVDSIPSATGIAGETGGTLQGWRPPTPFNASGLDEDGIEPADPPRRMPDLDDLIFAQRRRRESEDHAARPLADEDEAKRSGTDIYPALTAADLSIEPSQPDRSEDLTSTSIGADEPQEPAVPSRSTQWEVTPPSDDDDPDAIPFLDEDVVIADEEEAADTTEEFDEDRTSVTPAPQASLLKGLAADTAFSPIEDTEQDAIDALDQRGDSDAAQPPEFVIEAELPPVGARSDETPPIVALTPDFIKPANPELPPYDPEKSKGYEAAFEAARKLKYIENVVLRDSTSSICYIDNIEGRTEGFKKLMREIELLSADESKGLLDEFVYLEQGLQVEGVRSSEHYRFTVKAAVYRSLFTGCGKHAYELMHRYNDVQLDPKKMKWEAATGFLNALNEGWYDEAFFIFDEFKFGKMHFKANEKASDVVQAVFERCLGQDQEAAIKLFKFFKDNMPWIDLAKVEGLRRRLDRILAELLKADNPTAFRMMDTYYEPSYFEENKEFGDYIRKVFCRYLEDGSPNVFELFNRFESQLNLRDVENYQACVTNGFTEILARGDITITLEFKRLFARDFDLADNPNIRFLILNMATMQMTSREAINFELLKKLVDEFSLELAFPARYTRKKQPTDEISLGLADIEPDAETYDDTEPVEASGAEITKDSIEQGKLFLELIRGGKASKALALMAELDRDELERLEGFEDAVRQGYKKCLIDGDIEEAVAIQGEFVRLFDFANEEKAACMAVLHKTNITAHSSENPSIEFANVDKCLRRVLVIRSTFDPGMSFVNEAETIKRIFNFSLKCCDFNTTIMFYQDFCGDIDMRTEVQNVYAYLRRNGETERAAKVWDRFSSIYSLIFPESGKTPSSIGTDKTIGVGVEQAATLPAGSDSFSDQAAAPASGGSFRERLTDGMSDEALAAIAEIERSLPPYGADQPKATAGEVVDIDIEAESQKIVEMKATLLSHLENGSFAEAKGAEKELSRRTVEKLVFLEGYSDAVKEGYCRNLVFGNFWRAWWFKRRYGADMSMYEEICRAYNYCVENGLQINAKRILRKFRKEIRRASYTEIRRAT